MNQFEQAIEKIEHHFHEDLKSFRTSRATPDLVSGILVDAYGTHQPLRELASIGAQDSRTIVIEPWDKSILKSIEKGILSSGKSITPMIDGTILRITLPEMTEEARRALVKSLNENLEKSRVRVRKAREEEKKQIESSERSGSITEDDKRDSIKKLDQGTKSAIERLESAAKNKEKEIMTI